MKLAYPILLECDGLYDPSVWETLENHIIDLPVNVQRCGVDELGTSTKVVMSSHDFVDGCLNGTVTGYMKQQNVRKISPSLLENNAFPSFVLDAGWDRELLLWVGSPGSKTGLHRDPQDSVLLQFKGTKKVYIIEPIYRGSVYENEQYDTGSTDCCIDLELVLSHDPDHYVKYPRVKEIKSDDIWCFTIYPGQALFIPKGWYHQVETIGTGPSISVNAFIVDFMGYLFHERVRRIIRWMHNNGWLYKGKCQCHVGTVKMC